MLEIEADRRGPRRWWPALVGVAVIAVAGTLVTVARVEDHTAATFRSDPASVVPPAPPRVSLELAGGWQTLVADGDRLVVAIGPLGPADLQLAQLARDDVVFPNFPASGAVLVVGGDRLKAKYLTGPPTSIRTSLGGTESVELSSGASVGPGPALGLGPPKTLRGGITVRLGDVPKSGSTLAFYAGPKAPATAAADAEVMAATVTLAVVDPVAARPPPPPPGSRPGFDQGGVQLTSAAVAVASTVWAGVTYTIRAEGDCATVGPTTSSQASGGGCTPRPTGGGASVVALARDVGPPPLPPPPGQGSVPGPGPGPFMSSSQATIVLIRVGPDARRATARLVDGRSVDASVGSDGWAVVVTDGRPYLVDALDAKAKPVGQAPVT